MTPSRLQHFLLGLFTGLLGITVTILLYTGGRELIAHDSHLRIASERLDRHCMFIRMTLDQELDSLFSASPQQQVVARLNFEQLEREDWREVALCAPDGIKVTAGCDSADVGCMAAATTNALLAVTAR